MSPDSVAPVLAQIAVAAGRPIMDIRRRGFETARKADCSPVTEADLAAEALIVERLGADFPGIPIVAEELVSAGRIPEIGRRFLLVDPLDGTREFVAGRPEFTINLALVEDARPVAGAIYAPALERLWFAGTESRTLDIAPGGEPDVRSARRISVRTAPGSGIVALVSRSHLDRETEGVLCQLPVLERRAVGSSLKFALIAQGEADLYPRLGPTSEWDTAAGHAILVAAGGEVTARDGQPLPYGKKAARFRHGGFLACGGLRMAGRDIRSGAGGRRA